MSGHGGYRPGAGRKKNPLRTAAFARDFMAKVKRDTTGRLVSPLDFLLQAMLNEDLDFATRLDCAKSAAPYVHPRLSAVSVQDESANKVTIVVKDFNQLSQQVSVPSALPLPPITEAAIDDLDAD